MVVPDRESENLTKENKLVYAITKYATTLIADECMFPVEITWDKPIPFVNKIK